MTAGKTTTKQELTNCYLSESAGRSWAPLLPFIAFLKQEESPYLPPLHLQKIPQEQHSSRLESCQFQSENPNVDLTSSTHNSVLRHPICFRKKKKKREVAVQLIHSNIFKSSQTRKHSIERVQSYSFSTKKKLRPALNITLTLTNTIPNH